MASSGGSGRARTGPVAKLKAMLTLNRDIMSSTSTDSGVTFQAPRKINTSTGTRFAGRPQVALPTGAGVVWVWREQRGGTRDIYAASAADLTTTPATNTRVDGDTGNTRDSDFPRLVINETNAYVVWQDVSTVAGGGADAVFSRSTDAGATWSTERVIDDPSSEVSTSVTPAIAVDARTAGTTDDLVAIVWEDRRQGTQAYVSVSLDGGATFGAPVRASNETGDPIAGETTLPVIAASGSGVLTVAYQNKLPADTKTHAYVATSIDNGATWTFTHERLDGGAGSALAPQSVASVVGTAAAAVTAWTDFRANGIHGDIYTAVSR